MADLRNHANGLFSCRIDAEVVAPGEIARQVAGAFLEHWAGALGQRA